MLAKMVAPDWGNKLVTEITHQTTLSCSTRLRRGGPGHARSATGRGSFRGQLMLVRANRTGEVLRKMFTYAVSWGWRDDNPASSFRRRIENPRERFLCHEEIRKLAGSVGGGRGSPVQPTSSVFAC